MGGWVEGYIATLRRLGGCGEIADDGQVQRGLVLTNSWTESIPHDLGSWLTIQFQPTAGEPPPPIPEARSSVRSSPWPPVFGLDPPISRRLDYPHPLLPESMSNPAPDMRQTN